jgi:uncharacterized protein
MTALSSLVGGILIGLSAATLLLCNGDILGASGIISSVFISPPSSLVDPSQHWKLVFIASFLLSASSFYSSTFRLTSAALSPFGYAIAGLLVGFGTRLGNGCTSGHGICGLARLSKRSFVAVATFMGTAAMTIVLMSWPSSRFLRSSGDATPPLPAVGSFLSLASLGLSLFALLRYGKNGTKDDTAKIGPAALAGILFAHGLKLSGMTKSSKIFSFLDVRTIERGTWDPSLAFVMGGGVTVSWLAYQMVEGYQSLSMPLLQHPVALNPGSKFCVPTKTQIDRNLVVGSAIFGLGWGIAGICPGPGLFLAGTGAPEALLWLPSFVLGSYLGRRSQATQCR